MDVIDGEKLKQIELAKAKTDMAIEQTVQDHLNHDEVIYDEITRSLNTVPKQKSLRGAMKIGRAHV